MIGKKFNGNYPSTIGRITSNGQIVHAQASFAKTLVCSVIPTIGLEINLKNRFNTSSARTVSIGLSEKYTDEGGKAQVSEVGVVGSKSSFRLTLVQKLSRQ